jgi:hypothetical protein
MTEPRRYSIRARTTDIEPFLELLRRELEAEGWQERVHLHEPPHPAEIFEFEKDGEILSVEIDRHEMDECEFRLTASESDPNLFVLRVLSGLCADLIATFIGPVIGRVDRDSLIDVIRSRLEELVGRPEDG